MDPFTIAGLALGGSALLDYFGSKDAARAQERGAKNAQEALKASTDAARGDINRLFPQAAQMLQSGLGGSLSALQAAAPQQANLFSQGNVNAQKRLQQAMPAMQAAILGGEVDISQLMTPPTQQQVDFSFLQNAQMPDIVRMLQQGQSQSQTPNIGLAELLGGSTTAGGQAIGFMPRLER